METQTVPAMLEKGPGLAIMAGVWWDIGAGCHPPPRA